MAYSKDVREKLRRIYVFENQSLETASTLCEVNYSTARRWKESDKQDGNDWDKARAANILASGGLENIGQALLAGFVTQYQSTMEQLNNTPEIKPADRAQLLASLADAFNKTVSASKRILPETSKFATGLEVINLLSEYIKTKHPSLFVSFLEVLDSFGEDLERNLK